MSSPVALLVGIAGVLAASGVAAQEAAAGDGKPVCFEVVKTRLDGRGPLLILVDRCTGRTWELTRQSAGRDRRDAQGVLHWRSIAVPATIGGVPAAAPGRDAKAGAAGPGGCFAFGGRRYCE
jgi:hypothetical protein